MNTDHAKPLTAFELEEKRKKALDIVTRQDLWGKPKSEQFSIWELAILKLAFPKEHFLVKYAFWKQERRNGKYVVIIIDNFPDRSRPCAVDRALEIMCTRTLTDIEWMDELQNFGCNSRVMHMWEYRLIEQLVKGDKLCGAETPKDFIKEARKRGYTMKIIKPKTNA